MRSETLRAFNDLVEVSESYHQYKGRVDRNSESLKSKAMLFEEYRSRKTKKLDRSKNG